jgi:GntR family transcriptional regulator
MYLQLIEQIRRRVAVGDWGPGPENPSIRALAASTRVSVITIKRAYLELEREGVIVTRQGRGTFVAENVDLGRDLRSRELDERLAAAARLGTELGLEPDELAERLRDIAEAEEEKRR